MHDELRVGGRSISSHHPHRPARRAGGELADELVGEGPEVDGRSPAQPLNIGRSRGGGSVLLRRKLHKKNVQVSACARCAVLRVTKKGHRGGGEEVEMEVKKIH